jgi:L-gulonolactone oxidase
MTPRWANWTGDQRCSPVAIERPGTCEELAEVVRAATERGLTVRVSASGHSFSEIALTDGIMVRLDRLDRVLEIDRAAGRVKVEAGIVLADLNRRLDELGLAIENLGDIDRQTLAGSISTGTHGTGERRPSVSAQVEAVELVLSDGATLEIGHDDPAALAAARIGLGALGLIYAATLRVVPAFTLDRLDSPRPLADTLSRLDEHNRSSDDFEFLVFSHTETALCRQSRRTE